MRTTILRAASTLLLLLTGDQVLAQCTTSSGSTANFNTVRLDYSGVPSVYHAGIAAGMGAWNASSCNTGGTAFPTFVSSGTASESILVQYITGVNPAGQACAAISGSPDGTGAVIGLYSRILLNGVEHNCPTATDIVADTIAHELGHYLGLQHASLTSCPNYIMAPGTASVSGGTVTWSNARQIQSSECSQANTNSTTPAESGGGSGGGGSGGGGDGGAGDGDICDSGKEAYAIDCGSNGTWDHVVCLAWYEDPYEEGGRRCSGLQ